MTADDTRTEMERRSQQIEIAASEQAAATDTLLRRLNGAGKKARKSLAPDEPNRDQKQS